MIELGGNIKLVGFKDNVDGGTMIILKKMIGNFVKKVQEKDDKFKEITVTLKKVHETEGSKKFELKCKLDADRMYNSEITDRNLLFAFDKVLKKVESEMS